jgi:phosphoribosyl-ATP pyrophosphohydrolase
MKFPEIQTFNIEPEGKRQALKVLEEASEFVEAAKQCAERHTLLPFINMVDEAADVYMALANALVKLGVNEKSFALAVERCEQRNRERGRYDLAKELNNE